MSPKQIDRNPWFPAVRSLAGQKFKVPCSSWKDAEQIFAHLEIDWTRENVEAVVKKVRRGKDINHCVFEIFFKALGTSYDVKIDYVLEYHVEMDPELESLIRSEKKNGLKNPTKSQR
jgi:hypothetical protein